MISMDGNYDPLAEIHIPHACVVPADLYTGDDPATGPRSLKGCMVQAATNYNPEAVQSGQCHFRTKGCTSPTALNYNSEASIDDDSCIEAVYGCTLKAEAYAGVDPSTPGYKSLKVGVNVAFETYGWLTGMRPARQHAAVLNHDASANTLRGCTLAIEGCMEPRAVNYNPLANVNTNTWCVAAKRGCMIPNEQPSRVNTEALDLGGAANFNPYATVNHVPDCTIARIGCTDSRMANYDSLATVDSGECMPIHPGCLDMGALNFNCSSRGLRRCRREVPRVTLHEEDVCVYHPEPQPPPASPPLPECVGGCSEVRTVEVRFQAAGTVEEVNASAVALSFATQANTVDSRASGGYIPSPPMAWQDIEVIVTPASVLITVVLPARDAGAAADILTALNRVMGTAAAASAFLGIAVQSTPTLTTVVTQLAAPPMPPLAPIHALDELWFQYTLVAIVVGIAMCGALAWHYEKVLCGKRSKGEGGGAMVTVVPGTSEKKKPAGAAVFSRTGGALGGGKSGRPGLVPPAKVLPPRRPAEAAVAEFAESKAPPGGMPPRQLTYRGDAGDGAAGASGVGASGVGAAGPVRQRCALCENTPTDGSSLGEPTR